MTEKEQPYGDPMTYPFWEAAAEQISWLSSIAWIADIYQFYPRPFCLNCDSDQLEWKRVSGDATVYSKTTVHIKIAPEFDPPYVVALIELDEGPRMLCNIEGGEAEIGDRVKLAWREREDAPPLPIWMPA